MAEPTLGMVYYPIVTAFPWLLAGLILATARPSAVRVAIALVMFLAGLQTFGVMSAAFGWGLPAVPDSLDTAIGITLGFIASQFPAPWGARGRASLAAAVWAVALVGWLVLRGTGLVDPHLLLSIHDGAFILAGGILATHTIPKTLALAPGPLRAQGILVVAGIGMPLLRLLSVYGHDAVWLFPAFLEGTHRLRFYDGVVLALLPVGGYFMVASLVQAVLGARRRPGRDAHGLILALALGAGTGLFDASFFTVITGFHWSPTDEFLSQAARPLLLAVATMRYDLFLVPQGVRRPVLLAGASLFGIALFTMMTALLSGQGFFGERMNPLAPVGAVGLLGAATYLARSPIAQMFPPAALRHESGGTPADRRASLERYRLAMERARASGSPGTGEELRSLRERLGITAEQHEALDAVLASNLVIPTAALLGTPNGAVVGERYEVQRELGRGGQGRVLLARDRQAGGEVVLKEVLRPWEEGAASRREALRREAAALGRLASPHLPRVLGLVEESWQTYLVREFVPGEDLAKAVAARGPLDLPRSLAVAGDVLSGLEALHREGLLHLDVKPQNVVLRPDGRAVLIDSAAAARPRSGDPSAPEVEAKATVLRHGDGARDALTIRWAAPEQLLGRRLDERTDVYQAANLLAFALTGRSPSEGTTRRAVESDILSRKALAWERDHLPPGLREALERAMSAAPAERYADAAEMRAALTALPLTD